MLVFAFHMLRRDSCWREKLIWIRVFLFHRFISTTIASPAVDVMMTNNRENSAREVLFSERNLNINKVKRIWHANSVMKSIFDLVTTSAAQAKLKKKLFLKSLWDDALGTRKNLFGKKFVLAGIKLFCNEFIAIDCEKKLSHFETHGQLQSLSWIRTQKRQIDN